MLERGAFAPVGRALVGALAFVALSLAATTSAKAERPFDIGVLPGDVVLGNIAHFPGHAGVYIGRWADLPERLQRDYADVYERVLIRSRDHGLADSFLVVDSIGGRGVTLRSFTEQFTGYLPNGAAKGDLKKSLRWEASTGGAVAWPGLGVNDAKRWSIVEEALKAARARIPYDGTHLQRASTASFGSRVEWVNGIKTRETFNVTYEQMRKEGLDCITLVHVVYWRGAQIDLDVSWLPIHTPEQLHEEAKEKGYFRAVLFEDVFLDAALRGKWELTLSIVKSSDPDFADILPEKMDIWAGRTPDGAVTLDVSNKAGDAPAGDPFALPGKLVRTAADTLSFESVNLAGGDGTAVLSFEIGHDETLRGTYAGVDPPDSAGEGGGPFAINIEGVKVRDMLIPPK